MCDCRPVVPGAAPGSNGAAEGSIGAVEVEAVNLALLLADMDALFKTNREERKPGQYTDVTWRVMKLEALRARAERELEQARRECARLREELEQANFWMGERGNDLGRERSRNLDLTHELAAARAERGEAKAEVLKVWAERDEAVAEAGEAAARAFREAQTVDAQRAELAAACRHADQQERRAEGEFRRGARAALRRVREKLEQPAEWSLLRWWRCLELGGRGDE